MNNQFQRLQEAKETVLVFGPQSLTFDGEKFNQLHSLLRGSTANQWILETLANLPDKWPTLAQALPKLQQTSGEKWVDRLGLWLERGRIEDNVGSLPSVILTPLVVVEHLLQYFEYLKLSGGHVGSQSESKASLGFCIGLLAATAVSEARDHEQLVHNGVIAIHLAFIIGAVIDAYDEIHADGTAQSLAVAWDSPKRKAVLDEHLRSIPHAYISVKYDENRATVTLPQKRLPELQSQLLSESFVANPLPLYGCFHSCDHQSDLDGILEVLESDRTLHSLQADFASAVREILVEQSNWYDTVKTARESYPEATFVSFGSGKCIPPSILRDLESARNIHMPDLLTYFPRGRQPSDPEPRPGHSEDDIAIVGMSCKFSGADDVDEYWKTLLSGQSQHKPVLEDRFSMSTAFRSDDKKKRTWYANFVNDHDAFDHKFFKKSPREAASMDPQQRLILQVVYQALEQSGYFTASSVETDVGCYVGFNSVDYQHNVACHEPNAYTATGNLSGFIAGKISHYFGWTGPALVIDTACSASAVAIHQASRAVLSGECRQAIAGGSLIITSPLWFQNLAGASFLSPTGACKPFDANADGYCRGEGVAAVVLKRMSAAIADGDQILGCLAATGVRQNQNCTPIVVPNMPSLSSLFQDVLRKADLSPADISVVEAHGTGTPVGDPAEWDSIRTILGGERKRKQKLIVGSVKGHIGHTEGVSGAAALIKVLLMMHAGRIPPQASFSKLNPSLHDKPEDQMEVVTRAKPWDCQFRGALINNYGASGSNASMIITQPFKRRLETRKLPIHAAAIKHPFRLSGNDKEDISRNAARLLQWIREQPPIPASELAFNITRKSNPALPVGYAFSASMLEEAENQLQTIAADGALEGVFATSPERPVILCFGGQISTFVGLNLEVYNSFHVLRRHLDSCDAIVRSMNLRSIYPHIFTTKPETDPVSLQTMLFALQYACAKSWIDCGLKVTALVGHSFGELTALCISGILSLKDTIQVVARRAEIIKSQWVGESGTMLAVEAALADVQCLLNAAGKKARDQNETPATIACYNGPTTFTVAGSVKAIEAFEQSAADAGTKLRMKRLNVTNAFHSTLVEPLMKDLEQITSSIVFRSPAIPLMHSTETTLDGLPDPSFVADHLRNPVYFHHALSRLAKQYPRAIYLEAGTNSTVTNMAQRALGGPVDCRFQALNLMGANAASNLAEVTVQLWKAGARLLHWGHHPQQTLDYAVLLTPPRQFAKHRHWLELKTPQIDVQASTDTPAASASEVTSLWTFIGYTDRAESLARFSINTQSSKYERYLTGHVIAQEAPICPATLEMSIIEDAARSLLQGELRDQYRCIIKHVENQAAICKDSSRLARLEVQISNSASQAWSWKIFSTDRHMGACITHATGQILFQQTENKDYNLEFSRYGRLVSHDRCRQLLNDPSPDDTIVGRNVYRAFSDVVDYSDIYRGMKKLVGKGHESAGRIVIENAPDSDFDTVAADCFSQVAGIWVNCMTDRTHSTMYIANGIEQWTQSPKARAGAEFPRSFDVFATHKKVSSKSYCSDVFVFDSTTGELLEVVFGISYVEVSRIGMQRMLAKLTPQETQSGSSYKTESLAEPESGTRTLLPTPAVVPKGEDQQHQVTNSLVSGPKTSAAWDISRVRAQLKDILAELCGLEVKEIKDDAQLADLGVDSLMSMELLKEIEGAFKIIVPEENRVDVVDLPSLMHGVAAIVRGTGTSDSETTETESTEGESDASSATSVEYADGKRTSELNIDSGKWIAAFEEMNATTDDRIAEYGFSNYLAGINVQQTELCVAMILETFEKLGHSLAKVQAGATVPRIPHIKEHQRLVDYLYYVLDAEAALVEQKNGKWLRTSTPFPERSSDTILGELHREHSRHSDAFELAYYCGSHLAEILQGKETGVKLIFGSAKGRDLVSKLYGKWPLNVLYYNQMASLIENVATKLPRSDDPLKILEMGAGTAGTTKILLPRLAKLGIPIEYTFTDLSGAFVAAARKQFKQYDFMRFSVHDIEKQPPDELIGTQHVIIASNAVHATHDLAVSTANIKKALRPGGVLLMLEMTTPVIFIDIIFGLFEGWWLFSDDRNHAISHQDRWARVLRSVGFEHVCWTDGRSPEIEIERLIMAVAPAARYDNALASLPVKVPELSADLIAREIAIENYVRRYCEGWVGPRRTNSEPDSPEGLVILVTGATGSLGSNLVAHLASVPEVSKVVCLNRKSRYDGMERQLEAFCSRRIDLSVPGQSKLVVFETDTSKPFLGLGHADYEVLSQQVTHICHNAWPMSAQRALPGFEAQFQVMRNLIDLATSATSKHNHRVHFQLVSSIAVVGHYPLWTGKCLVPEERMCIRSVLPNGYGDAKYTCELMLDATLHHHPEHFAVHAVRPGQIAGSKHSGIWNTAEHLSFLVKSSQTLGAVPAFEGELSWTPVEDVAATCADLLLRNDHPQPVYHIDNPVRQPWGPMVRLWAEDLAAEVVPFEEWIRRVKDYGGNAVNNPAIKLLGFLDENFVRMSCGGLLLGTEHCVADSRTLARVGPVNDEVARRYIQAWKESGFLKA
ncbi:putative polyketide synthase [Myriangium duriaei CBS 260.36]|uniref:Polyketide synthase n=1 Tax=Myriangium duriaei CBS 260.36 TaxID=1168546 RepID=A0A9P4MFN7_9PEZI|nr:putative polyketide synthase [Myriangium duriaei CBS 260.36]